MLSRSALLECWATVASALMGIMTGKLVEVNWRKGKEVSSSSNVLQNFPIGKMEYLKEALPRFGKCQRFARTNKASILQLLSMKFGRRKLDLK